MTIAAVSTVAGQRSGSSFMLWFLGVTLATSSVVFIEPAPYDFLVMGLFGMLLLTGLRFPREIRLAVLLLGLFALGNLIAAAASADPATTIRSLSIRIYMILAWCLFVTVIVADPDRVLRVIWQGYLVAALVAVAWGVLEYFGVINFGDWQPGLRAKGPFKDANVYAPFLVPPTAYALSRVATGDRWTRKLLYMLIFIALAFGILLSFSRGAWLNFLVVSSLVSLMALVGMPTHRARLQWLLLNVFIVFAVIGVLGGSATQSNIADRLAQRAVLAQKYDVARGGRFYTQKQALQKIATTPQGIGPGRSHDEFGLEPHNLILHVFVEGGWLAGAGFLLFVALGFYRSLDLFRWQAPLRKDFLVVFASVVGIMVQSLFIDSTHWRHSWLLFGMLWGLIVVRQRVKTEESVRHYVHRNKKSNDIIGIVDA